MLGTQREKKSKSVVITVTSQKVLIPKRWVTDKVLWEFHEGEVHFLLE